MSNKKFTPIFKGFKRMGNFPLDDSTVFESIRDLENYIENGMVYQGQIVSVRDYSDYVIYVISYENGKYTYKEAMPASSEGLLDRITGQTPFSRTYDINGSTEYQSAEFNHDSVITSIDLIVQSIFYDEISVFIKPYNSEPILLIDGSEIFEQEQNLVQNHKLHNDIENGSKLIIRHNDGRVPLNGNLKLSLTYLRQ